MTIGSRALHGAASAAPPPGGGPSLETIEGTLANVTAGNNVYTINKAVATVGSTGIFFLLHNRSSSANPTVSAYQDNLGDSTGYTIINGTPGDRSTHCVYKLGAPAGITSITITFSSGDLGDPTGATVAELSGVTNVYSTFFNTAFAFPPWFHADASGMTTPGAALGFTISGFSAGANNDPVTFDPQWTVLPTGRDESRTTHWDNPAAFSAYRHPYNAANARIGSGMLICVD